MMFRKKSKPGSNNSNESLPEETLSPIHETTVDRKDVARKSASLPTPCAGAKTPSTETGLTNFSDIFTPGCACADSLNAPMLH